MTILTVVLRGTAERESRAVTALRMARSFRAGQVAGFGLTCANANGKAAMHSTRPHADGRTLFMATPTVIRSSTLSTWRNRVSRTPLRRRVGAR
jgi:hypothetical protein